MRRSSILHSIDGVVSREIEPNKYQDVVTVGQNIADVVTVADNLNSIPSSIDTVAGSIGSVDILGPQIAAITTLATNIAALLSLYGIQTELLSLYADKATLDSLFADKVTLDSLFADKLTLDSLFTDKATLDSLYADKITLDALYASLSNIDAVGTNIANVNTVATNIADVNTTAANIANINTVASIANLDNITTVANDLNSLDLNGIADVTIVANDLVLGANSLINITSGNMVDINTVAAGIADINNYADTYYGSLATAPTLISHPTLTTGDQYFDTVLEIMRVYTGTEWIASASSVNGTTVRESFIAGTPSGSYDGISLTTFPIFGGYDANYADVYFNGKKLLNGSDVDITDGVNVVLTLAATAGDVIDFIGYGTFLLADHYSKAVLDAGQLDTRYYTQAQIAAMIGVTIQAYDATILVDADIGTTVQAYDVDTTKNDVANVFTVAQVGTVTADNDLSFDMNGTTFFTCTPVATGALTFTNIGAGKSIGVKIDNSSAQIITAPSTTHIANSDLTLLSTAGVYEIVGTCYDGTNVNVTVSKAQTAGGA